MGSQWGKNIKISIFGESHGRGIGVVMDGLPSGIELCMDKINCQMERRAPGRNKWSTKRKEGDKVEILSGLYNGYTTGTPLSAVIFNSDTKSGDYASLENVPRPGHADFPGKVRYQGYNDPRGGGHFSGRLTAPIVFAGSVAEQILIKKGVFVGAHIKSIETVTDVIPDYINIDETYINNIRKKDFPTIDDQAAEHMKRTIENARMDQDSVGGEITAFIGGMPAGIGSPIFETIESVIASLAMSIPAVKGIAFGTGFDITKLRGSVANDQYRINDGKVVCKTNNNGGILGGISNGMPIVFTVAVKPTASISKIQDSVNLNTMENTELRVHGRHDPCIVPRAVPVIEAVAALSIADIYCKI